MIDKYVNKIIQGPALCVLKTFPPESIDMIMTSPPYWALRDYDIEDQIWDGDKNCKHKWGKKLPEHHPGQVEQTKWNKAEASGKGQTAKSGRFCIKCNAWRGSLGLEPTFDLYIKHLCDIFGEAKRVLKKDGTCWVNLGDTYSATRWSDSPSTTGISKKHCDIVVKKKSNLPDKCFCQIPARFSIEMIDNRGWILRNEIIWHKRNCMPSSADDRFTVDYEKLFFFTKNAKYYFEQQFDKYIPDSDMAYRKTLRMGKQYKVKGPYKKNFPLANSKEAIPDPRGRNKRCVWTINTKPYSEAHFAVYPEELCQTPIKAGCPKGGIVLDPFMGAGTTALTALKLGRKFIGIELSPEYIKIAEKRIWQEKNQLKLL